MIPYSIPFLGNAIAYGIDPIKFLQECNAKVFWILLVWELLHVFDDGQKDDFLFRSRGK